MEVITNILKDHNRQEQADKLFTQALQHLEQHDYQAALVTVRQCRQCTTSIEQKLALKTLTVLSNKANNNMTDAILKQVYKI